MSKRLEVGLKTIVPQRKRDSKCEIIRHKYVKTG